MKKINTVLLNARKNEKEDFLKLSIQLAKLEAAGIDDVQAKTKEMLNLPEDAIILLEGETALRKIQQDTQNFIAFGNALEKARETGLVTEDELAPMVRVVKSLEADLMKTYEIDSLEDLYEGDE